EAVFIENLLQAVHVLFDATEGNAPFQQAKIAVIASEENGPQQGGDFPRALNRNVRVPVAVASRPEAKLNDGCFFFRTYKAVGKSLLNVADNGIEYIFKEPGQTHRLIDGSRLLLFDKGRFAQLLQQGNNIIEVVVLDRLRQIGYNTQYGTGI